MNENEQNSFDYVAALKAMQAEKLKQWESSGGSCPHCGYCPHCGRSAAPLYPVYPWYQQPHYYQTPWYVGTVTTGGLVQPGNTLTVNNAAQHQITFTSMGGVQ